MAILFRRSIERAAAGGTFDELEFRPELDGRIYTVRRVAVEDETTTPTGALRLYIAGHGNPFWLDEVPAPAVGRLYVFQEPVQLFQGERLVARLTGCTAGDAIRMYVNGWSEQPGESDVLAAIVRDLVPVLLGERAV